MACSADVKMAVLVDALASAEEKIGTFSVL